MFLLMFAKTDLYCYILRVLLILKEPWRFYWNVGGGERWRSVVESVPRDNTAATTKAQREMLT